MDPVPAIEPDGGLDPMLSVDTLHPAPADYARQRIGDADHPVPPWAGYLEGIRILLDPGHGGDAHRRGYKRGPTGVREAEMNLRIARYLRDFLEHVGAEVRLTRDADVDVSLAERAEMANAWPADLFISLHHNAVDGRPQTNYTTVWYHGTVDRHPSSLDLARHLSDALHDALRLPRFVDVPLKSDQLMYQEGFGVLRPVRVTAALTESSFFTHPPEEQRLRDPAYNLREAHGLFLGLARYAAAGLPRARLTGSATVSPDEPRELVFAVTDGLRDRKAWGHERRMILSDSIRATIGGRTLSSRHDDEAGTITVDLPALPAGSHVVELHFENMNKNSVLDRFFPIRVTE